ncbi:MAG: hypothetical protein DME58_01730 [Verrucomicrobia bacterium]|nr:MAG: hypothetical protein DME58_01730 [Verrucomicrobiota bacterium]
MFLPCTPKSELRRWHNSLQRRSTRRNLFIDLNGRNKGLTGKGVVLVTIDQQTGKVTGARMLQSTGNKQLDGAALEAYSQWRFQPGTGSQVKIPIEFASRPKPPAPKRAASQPAILYPLLILLGFGVAVIAMRTRRRNAR